MTASRRFTDDQLTAMTLVGVFLPMVAGWVLPDTTLFQLPIALISSAICVVALIQMHRAGWFNDGIDLVLRIARRK